MPQTGQGLQAVLDGYAKFLLDKDLALPKHEPYLVGWVRQFLDFAREHAGYTFEQTLDLFLAEIGKRVGSKLWQVRQAADAVRIYRRQNHSADAHRQVGAGKYDGMDAGWNARMR
jgi:hypothetical protein